MQSVKDDRSMDAAKAPLELISSMAQRDGEDQGGLTLTREHIITLNKYANYIFTLPTARVNVEQWLDYKTIDQPELMPNSMEALFKALRGHADKWIPLSDRSKGLAADLGVTANQIDSAGQYVIKYCNSLDAFGDDWRTVTFDKPLKLGASDKSKVGTLVKFIEIIQSKTRAHVQRVNDVKRETERFRDEARIKLIPAVKGKSAAVKARQGSGNVEKLRARIKDLDGEIAKLDKEYQQYIKGVMGLVSGGPLALLVGGAIYGVQAEKARKARNHHQRERATASMQLAVEQRLEGRMELMKTFMADLETRLEDVVVAAGHLHTVWMLVDQYLAASIDTLNDIDDCQELILFLLHFEIFVGQWKPIEKISRSLTKVFDDAAAAK